MMSAVLRELTGTEPMHLHFGGANVVPSLGARVDIRRFAVDDRVEPLPFPDMVSCVETLIASGARRAVGLRRTSTGAVEIVWGAGVPAVANAARARVWQTAVETAANLPDRRELDSWGLDQASLAREVRDLLTGFWTAPETAHAVAAAQLSFEVDEAGAVVGPVASAYRVREFLGPSHPTLRQWREGSLALTPEPFRSVIRVALAAKDRLAS
jgi:hypothetical protein